MENIMKRPVQVQETKPVQTKISATINYN